MDITPAINWTHPRQVAGADGHHHRRPDAQSRPQHDRQHRLAADPQVIDERRRRRPHQRSLPPQRIRLPAVVPEGTATRCMWLGTGGSRGNGDDGLILCSLRFLLLKRPLVLFAMRRVWEKDRRVASRSKRLERSHCCRDAPARCRSVSAHHGDASANCGNGSACCGDAPAICRAGRDRCQNTRATGRNARRSWRN